MPGTQVLPRPQVLPGRQVLITILIVMVSPVCWASSTEGEQKALLQPQALTPCQTFAQGGEGPRGQEIATVSSEQQGQGKGQVTGQAKRLSMGQAEGQVKGQEKKEENESRKPQQKMPQQKQSQQPKGQSQPKQRESQQQRRQSQQEQKHVQQQAKKDTKKAEVKVQERKALQVPSQEVTPIQTASSNSRAGTTQKTPQTKGNKPSATFPNKNNPGSAVGSKSAKLRGIAPATGAKASAAAVTEIPPCAAPGAQKTKPARKDTAPGAEATKPAQKDTAPEVQGPRPTEKGVPPGAHKAKPAVEAVGALGAEKNRRAEGQFAALTSSKVSLGATDSKVPTTVTLSAEPARVPVSKGAVPPVVDAASTTRPSLTQNRTVVDPKATGAVKGDKSDKGDKNDKRNKSDKGNRSDKSEKGGDTGAPELSSHDAREAWSRNQSEGATSPGATWQPPTLAQVIQGAKGLEDLENGTATVPREPYPFPPMAYSWRSREFKEEFEFQWWCNNTWLCNQNPDGSITLNTYWKDRCSGTVLYCTVFLFHYYRTILFTTVLYSTVRCRTVLYCMVLHVPYCMIQHNRKLCRTSCL